MKIASWNVNSVKARLDHVKQWLEKNRPDVLMIQELKGENFPAEEFIPLGYRTEAVAQKAYNGVATFSLHPIEVLERRMPGEHSDDQSRYLESRIKGIRFINIYLPNGNPVGTEKYTYKLEWMERLKRRVADLRYANDPFLIAGDFNVIPEPVDCYDPRAWIDDALFRLESRRAYRAIVNQGLTDALRAFHHAPGLYTFWDYGAGAWPRNNGIRIDHILCSPPVADRLQSCNIDREPRAWDRPSDHTPIIATLSAAAS